jgi:hypothetical protein
VSAALSCTATPLSWLRLELYHAGELAAEERTEITAHLATCAACAACFATIVDDAQAPLAALPAAMRDAPAKSEATREATPLAATRLRGVGRFAPVVAALAMAAALLLVLGKRGDDGVRHAPTDDPSAARTKGGAVAFALVRDDAAVVAEAAGSYRDGDRWKAVVTCPAGMRAAWDVVVFERGEAAFPLAPMPDLACGNGVPLPGAFRTTGRERMTVCLVWSDGKSVDRARLRGASPDALAQAACKVLEPAP